MLLLLSILCALADDAPSFGSDASIGYGGGALLGTWPDAGIHGYFHGRLDLFTADREASGPRLGASIWATQTLYPLQFAREDDTRFKFPFSQYGVMAVLRDDPQATVGGDFGFGFGRIDINDYWDGPQVLPTLSFEAGPRIKSSDTTFVDILAHADWATERGHGDILEEWWGVGLQLALGMHVR